jgi:hypothetical protein
MLSKCVNYACSVRFLYLHEGKLFKVDTPAPPHRAHSEAGRRIEHFWLCGRCAQTLTVVVENGVVTTRPRHLLLSAGEPEVTEVPGR